MYQEIHHTIHLDGEQQVQQYSTRMCSCDKCHNHAADICFYVPFCIIFVFFGIVQIISGIFYFITIPLIKLILNVAIGCWVSKRKQFFLCVCVRFQLEILFLV